MNLLGVDLGIHKVNAAVFCPGAVGFTLYDVPGHVSDAPTRPAQLWECSRWLLDTIDFYNADSVWIEDIIIGNNRKYSLQLAQMMGAVLSVMSVLEKTCDVRLVDNQRWKKEVVGSGHASKEQVKNYIVETHPVYAALCGDDQDAYDATCIGLYGLRILDRADSLTL